MTSTIFQASDLANQKRVDFLSQARAGRARLRDKDGTSLVMLPESHLLWLETMAQWSSVHLRLEGVIRRATLPTVSELGDLAWLRAFDIDDLTEFVEELHEALVVSNADQNPSRLEECVNAWRVTARQLEDPLRRSVLLGAPSISDFDDAPRPDASLPDDEEP
ncbi:hypothetical protein [Actinoplanes sp. NPDC051851]|uniref:hypothetical protein n=1 Tax=Actinoplanes sp. NPDC051851 TaxID=3154753 RepID=UPI0034332526